MLVKSKSTALSRAYIQELEDTKERLEYLLKNKETCIEEEDFFELRDLLNEKMLRVSLSRDEEKRYWEINNYFLEEFHFYAEVNFFEGFQD
jgi:uncharacterized protein YpmB